MKANACPPPPPRQGVPTTNPPRSTLRWAECYQSSVAIGSHAVTQRVSISCLHSPSPHPAVSSARLSAGEARCVPSAPADREGCSENTRRLGRNSDVNLSPLCHPLLPLGPPTRHACRARHTRFSLVSLQTGGRTWRSTLENCYGDATLHNTGSSTLETSGEALGEKLSAFTRAARPAKKD